MLLEVERVTNVPRNTFIAHFSYPDDWITKLNTLMKSSCTTVVNHRQRGSDCTVLTATGLVNGEGQILTPYRIETSKPIDKNICTRDYVREMTLYTKSGANPSTGGFWVNR